MACFLFDVFFTILYIFHATLFEIVVETHTILLCTVLDTATGVWCDTKPIVISPRTGNSADAAGGDVAVELTR